ncbi:arginase family protein [Leucobacter sp. BZR 635]
MPEPSKPIFLVMPEWQGSASSRAMLLTDGAELLREDLPPSSRFDVPVPAHAGDSLGTPIARLSSLLTARNGAREILRSHTAPAITLGGDCASTLAGVERAVAADPGVAVLWFDAHPDLQHPSTSPSGAASGMALRHALGRGAEDLNSEHPLDPARVLCIGAREIDPEEEDAIAEFGVRLLPATAGIEPVAAGDAAGHAAGDAAGHAAGDAADAAAAAAFASQIAAWLTEREASSVYIHVDFDVLDPAEFASVHQAVPFGLTVAALTQAIRAAVAVAPLTGAALCEFAPGSAATAAEDAPTVLRILAALVSGGTA